MCCTLHPSRLTGTKIYAGEAIRDGRYVHLLGYKNAALNDHPGPNAMILPIPALFFGQDNAIDTRPFKGFLDDIAVAVGPNRRSRATLSKGADRRSEVFDVGSYTVVTANNARSIKDAIRQVPANKRPELNMNVLNSFQENYPDWPLAVCCWDGAIGPEPLLFWYEPRNPDLLFAPALDAHDGTPPKRGAVDVDHFVMFGSTIRPMGFQEIHYKGLMSPDVMEIMPIKAVGKHIVGYAANGDFWYPTLAFRKGSQVEAREIPVPPAHRWFPTTGTPESTAEFGLST